MTFKIPQGSSGLRTMAQQQQAAREGVIAQRKANGARRGVSEHQHVTAGVGNIRLTSPIMFDLIFTQEPQFSYGCAVLRHPNPTEWFDPHGSAVVRGWLHNSSGGYTGANVSFRVVMDRAGTSSSAAPIVEIVHFLTFSAVAYKVISGIDDEMSNMDPTSTGWS